VDKVHYWTNTGDRIPYTVGFWVQEEAWAKFSYCVADTVQIAFKCDLTMWLDHCQIITGFLDTYFDGMCTAIYLNESTYDQISVSDCVFEDHGAGINCLNIDDPTALQFKTVKGNYFWGTCYNKLIEDYEVYSSTFTPSIAGTTTAGTPTYTTQFGRYHKVGKQVWITVNIRATMDALIDGDLVITGLPYTATSGQVALNVGYINNFPERVINPTIIGSSNKITFYEVHEDKTCSTVWSQDVRSSTIEVWVTGSYIIK
jgi:hypothetical protein